MKLIGDISKCGSGGYFQATVSKAFSHVLSLFTRFNCIGIVVIKTKMSNSNILDQHVTENEFAE